MIYFHLFPNSLIWPDQPESLKNLLDFQFPGESVY